MSMSGAQTHKFYARGHSSERSDWRRDKERVAREIAKRELASAVDRPLVSDGKGLRAHQ